MGHRGGEPKASRDPEGKPGGELIGEPQPKAGKTPLEKWRLIGIHQEEGQQPKRG